MKNKIIVISFAWLLVTTHALSQKKDWTTPSLTAGIDWLLLNGVGVNAAAAFPFSEGFAFMLSSNYDHRFSKFSWYTNFVNFAAGVKFGDVTDLHAEFSVGYAILATPNDYYYLDETIKSISLSIGGGYVFKNFIDVGGEINFITNKRDQGIYIPLRIKLGYVFKLKKKTK